MMKELDDTNE